MLESSAYAVSTHLKWTFFVVFSFFTVAAISSVSLGSTSSFYGILLLGIAAFLVIIMVLFIVFIFIQKLLRVWTRTDGEVTNLRACIVNNFLLTMLSIISLFLVMLYAVGWIWIRNNLVYDTIVNSLVFRFDLVTNLISILYSVAGFEKYYVFLSGSVEYVTKNSKMFWIRGSTLKRSWLVLFDIYR